MKIIFFSAVKYNSVISGRTKQLALELSRLGHDITFVEMPGIRNVRIPLFKVQEKNNIQIITLPPFPGSFKLLNTVVGVGWMKTVKFLLNKTLFFENYHCVVSNPWWARLLNSMTFKSVTYDCIDHLSVHCSAGHLKQMKKWEQVLLDICKHILIVCPALKGKLGAVSRNKDTTLIPNGVPEEWFNMQQSKKDHKRPQVGFIGSLYEWIDQNLIIFAAQSLPQMDFILIGPTRSKVSYSKLAEVPNITIQPSIPFEKVPERIAEFDVCLIPFKQDIISECADPLKLYEYLALGKPVVSSINWNTKAPIYLGNTYERFIAAIETALSGKNDNIAVRKKFASAYTWRKQAEKIVEVLT